MLRAVINCRFGFIRRMSFSSSWFGSRSSSGAFLHVRIKEKDHSRFRSPLSRNHSKRGATTVHGRKRNPSFPVRERIRKWIEEDRIVAGTVIKEGQWKEVRGYFEIGRIPFFLPAFS